MNANDKDPQKVVAPDGHSNGNRPSRSLEVLVVEDNPVNQKVVVALLHKWGHHSVVAGDGAHGLAALERQPFDLVLMDIQMPVMDGLAATRSIREREREHGGHVPIIGITAHAKSMDKANCLEVGMDRYLTKPLNSELLRSAIAELIPTAATGPSESAPEIVADEFNFEQLREFVGDDSEFLAEVIQIFLEEAPATLENAECAIADSNANALAKSAHRLKGSLLTMGATTAAETARLLELQASEGVLDGAAELCARLRREIDATREHLLLWSSRAAA